MRGEFASPRILLVRTARIYEGATRAQRVEASVTAPDQLRERLGASGDRLAHGPRRVGRRRGSAAQRPPPGLTIGSAGWVSLAIARATTQPTIGHTIARRVREDGLAPRATSGAGPNALGLAGGHRPPFVLRG
jgi:hypothetical protein